jgi:predicted transcriptional regulator of viral defense system
MNVDGPKTHVSRGKSARQRGGRRADGLIADLAARQHGVVSLTQLMERGLSERAVHDRAVASRLHRIHQGVYAVGHPLLTQEGRWMAAVLACGPGAVLSHRSAAALWGLRRDGRSTVDVTAPCRRGRIPIGIDAHRHSSLHNRDRTTVKCIPCTSVARTLLDIAATVSPRQLHNAITEAEVLRAFDLVAVQDVISRSRRRRGVARLRRSVGAYDSRHERTRGELERRFLTLCARSELPPPEVNAPLVLDGMPIEADFLWRDARLIVEADSRRFHDTVSAFESDRRRDQHLLLAGWRVIRCTWRQVVDQPGELTLVLRNLLAQVT